jgi:ferredoxin
MIQVTFITNDNKTVQAPENSNLLRVSLREKGGIPFKCGGGLCGTCKCRIEQGIERHRRHQAQGAQAPDRGTIRRRLAHGLPDLRAGDVSVSWPPPPPKPGSTAA